MHFGEFSPTYVLNKVDISALESVLLENGQLKIVPYDELKPFSQEQISQFCTLHGFYSIPTQELIDFLQSEIGETPLDKVIEIAAGNGVMAKALGIKATDSFMQEREEIRAIYEEVKQTIVPYGEHVERLLGNDAVRKYKPQIVIAAWCTHAYSPKAHWRGGNSYGVNESLIIERVDKYIHIGNINTHKLKPALAKKHRSVQAEWLVSRALNKQNNVIYIWEKKQ